MKNILIVIAAIVVLGGGYWLYSSNSVSPEPVVTTEENATTGTKTVPPQGAYVVDSAASTIEWSVGKPLIAGYVNSGTIGIKEGTMEVSGASATGSFIIDMETIHVGLTAKKPGKESALEKHLKSDDFFDVEKYPTGSFAITKIEAKPDSDTSHEYQVSGDLTLKGKTLPIVIPAQIYLEDGKVHTNATFTIDRTKWGITYGSGSFFQNLADNAIEDTIHLTIKVIASPK